MFTPFYQFKNFCKREASYFQINRYHQQLSPQVQKICIIAIAIILVSAACFIGFVITAALCGQPLFFIGSAICFAIILLTLFIARYLIKKCYVHNQNLILSPFKSKTFFQNIPKREEIQNCSILKQSQSHLVLKYSKDSHDINIDFVFKAPSRIFNSKEHKKLNTKNIRTGYVGCTRENEYGSHPIYPESLTLKHYFSEEWNQIYRLNSPFTVSQAEANSLSKQYPEHPKLPSPYLILTYSHPVVTQLNSLQRTLTNSYKNIFRITKTKHITRLCLPVLGVNKNLCESTLTTRIRTNIALHTLFDCLHTEIATDSSIREFVIFVDTMPKEERELFYTQVCKIFNIS